MTEERSCNNCAICLICQECNDDNIKWQPIAQEKPMENKAIFESEEQLRKFVDDCIFIDEDENNMDDIVQYARIGNYIRKSALEEAEEMYREWLNRIGDMSETVVMEMDKMYSAIQEFKSEIARGKK